MKRRPHEPGSHFSGGGKRRPVSPSGEKASSASLRNTLRYDVVMIQNDSPKGEAETVSCPCGASVEVDLGGRRPVVVCPECHETLKIVVTLDPRTGKKKVGILVSPMAVVPQKTGKEKAPAKAARALAAVGEGMYKPLCTCGSEVIVDFRSVDSVFTCGWCGASFTALLKTDKETGEKTPVLIPVQVVPLSKERPRSSRKLPKAPEPSKIKTTRKVAAAAAELEEIEDLNESPPKSKTVRRTAPAEAPTEVETNQASPPRSRSATLKAPPPSSAAGKEALFLTAKGQIGAQEIVSGEEGPRIYCFCGKEIVLLGEATNRLLRCVECGLSFRVITGLEPRTKKPMAVTIPRSAPSPKGKAE